VFSLGVAPVAYFCVMRVIDLVVLGQGPVVAMSTISSLCFENFEHVRQLWAGQLLWLWWRFGVEHGCVSIVTIGLWYLGARVLVGCKVWGLA